MKSVKVTILGKQYPLKVNDDDEQSIHDIAHYVDERFRLFKKQLSNQNETTILVLSCLSIAEELFLEKNQRASSKAKSGSLADAAFFDEANHTLESLLREIRNTNPAS